MLQDRLIKTLPGLFLSFLCLLIFTVSIPAPRGFSSFPTLMGIMGCVYYFISYRVQGIKIFHNILYYKRAFFTGHALFLFFIFTSFFAFNAEFAFERTLKLYLLFLSGFIGISLSHTLDIEQRQRVFRALTYGFILGTFLITFEYFSGNFFYNYFRPLDNPVEYSYVLNRPLMIVCCLLWILVAFYRKETEIKVLLLLAGLILAFFSDSQSAQVGMIVGFLVYLCTLLARDFLIKACFVATGVVLLTMPWIAGYLYTKKPEPLMNLVASGAPGPRLEIWEFTTRYISQKPVIGWGLEASRNMKNFGEPSKVWPGETIAPLHPHNAALQIWLEFGFVGILVTLFLLYKLYKKLRNFPETLQPAFMGCYTCVGIIFLFSHGIWQSWWLSVIIFLALFWQILLEKEKSRA